MGNSLPKETQGTNSHEVETGGKEEEDTMELIDPEGNHMDYQLLNNHENSRNENNRMGGQSDDIIGHNRDHGDHIM